MNIADPQDRVRLIQYLKSKRSVRNLEVSRRIKQGDLRHFLISTDVVMLGKTRCLLTIGNDITDRKRAEKALRSAQEELERRVQERTEDLERANAALTESEERFRTFLDHAPNLAFIKATDGRYLYANRRFEEVFRLDQNDIVGKTDKELFSREQADQYQTNDRLVLETEQAMEFEEVALYADGLHTSIVVKFGKSTLLGALIGTTRVFSGQARSRPGIRVAIQSQAPVRLAEMPVTGAEFLRITGAHRHATPPRLVPSLGQRLDRLSGGQYQLLNVWACLGSPAELVILDEPTNNMDPKAVRELAELLLESREKGRGVLVVSHEHEPLERVSSRLVEIRA